MRILGLHVGVDRKAQSAVSLEGRVSAYCRVSHFAEATANMPEKVSPWVFLL